MGNSWLRSLMFHDLVIDLGTENTVIQAVGSNISFSEPSIIAIAKRDDETWTPLCAGSAASTIEDKNPALIKVVRPLADGVIVDEKMAYLMLKTILSDKMPQAVLGIRNILISAPFAISSVEARAFLDLAKSLKPHRVFMVAEPLAAAVGADLPVLAKPGQLIVDIGKGIIEAIVTSHGCIVAASSMRLGGRSDNERLINHCREYHNLSIGLQTAERIKRTLYSNNHSDYISVSGKSKQEQMPRKINISAGELIEVLKPSIEQVLECIMRVLEKAPIELVTDIVNSGIFLTGGGALRHDLVSDLQKKLALSIMLVRNPLQAVASGNQQILSSKNLRSILCQQESAPQSTRC